MRKSISIISIAILAITMSCGNNQDPLSINLRTENIWLWGEKKLETEIHKVYWQNEALNRNGSGSYNSTQSVTLLTKSLILISIYNSKYAK